MLKPKWFFFLIVIWQTAGLPLLRKDDPSDDIVIIKCSASKTTDQLKARKDDNCMDYKYTTDECATFPKEDSVNINDVHRSKRDLKKKNCTEEEEEELNQDATIAEFLVFVRDVRDDFIMYFEDHDLDLPLQVLSDDEEKTDFANDFVTATDYIFLVSYNILFGYPDTDLAKKYYPEILKQFDDYCGDNKTNIEKYETFLGLLLQYYKNKTTVTKDVFEGLGLLIDWNQKTDYHHLVHYFLNKQLYKLELFFLHWEDNEEFKNFSAIEGQLLANQKMENTTFSMYDLAYYLVTEVMRNTELGKFSIGSLLIDNSDNKFAQYYDTTVIGYTFLRPNESTLIGIRKPRNFNYNFTWPDESYLLGIRKKRDDPEYYDLQDNDTWSKEYTDIPDDETWSEDDGFTFESPIVYIFMNLSKFFPKEEQEFAKNIQSIRIDNYNYSWGNDNDRKKRNTPEISELENYKFVLKNASKWFGTKQTKNISSEENMPKAIVFTVPCFKKISFSEMQINKKEKRAVSIANDEYN